MIDLYSKAMAATRNRGNGMSPTKANDLIMQAHRIEDYYCGEIRKIVALQALTAGNEYTWHPEAKILQINMG